LMRASPAGEDKLRALRHYDGRVPGTDIGGTCTGARNLGSLGDDCSSNAKQAEVCAANLPTKEDTDVYYFYAENGGGDLFGCECTSFFTCNDDSFQVRVSIATLVPGMSLCVSTAQSCGGYSQNCIPVPYNAAAGAYKAEVAMGGDSTTVTVTVQWQTTATPACGVYYLKFRSCTDDGCGVPASSCPCVPPWVPKPPSCP